MIGSPTERHGWRRLLLRRILTRQDLAALLQVDRSSVWRWEHRGLLPNGIVDSALRGLVALERDELERVRRYIRRGQTCRALAIVLHSAQTVINEDRARDRAQRRTAPDRPPPHLPADRSEPSCSPTSAAQPC